MKKDKKSIAKIREILKTTEVEFTVKGKTKIFETCCYNEEWKDCGSIWSEFHGMNVSKWGPTCVTLYSYNMLQKKSTGRIKYSDIENFSPKTKNAE